FGALASGGGHTNRDVGLIRELPEQQLQCAEQDDEMREPVLAREVTQRRGLGRTELEAHGSRRAATDLAGRPVGRKRQRSKPSEALAPISSDPLPFLSQLLALPFREVRILNGQFGRRWP